MPEKTEVLKTYMVVASLSVGLAFDSVDDIPDEDSEELKQLLLDNLIDSLRAYLQAGDYSPIDQIIEIDMEPEGEETCKTPSQ